MVRDCSLHTGSRDFLEPRDCRIPFADSDYVGEIEIPFINVERRLLEVFVSL